MSSDEVLDPETIAELRHAGEQLGNPAFLSQLVDLFRMNAPRRMDQIRGAVAARDAATLERTAHTLKSNCAIFGATRLAACCGELEDAAFRADFAAAARPLADAETEFPRVFAAVTALA